jgi:hypothetical protein
VTGIAADWATETGWTPTARPAPSSGG